MAPPRKTVPEKSYSNTLVSWVDMFLTAFYEEHLKKNPGTELPSVILSTQDSTWYKICQVSLCDALLTYAPDSGSVANHLLIHVFGQKVMDNLKNLQTCGLSDYFRSLICKEGFEEKFEEYCRGWIDGFLIPLNNKQHFPTLTSSQLNQVIRQKDRCLVRDGYCCPVTGVYDINKPHLPITVETASTLNLAHIIPLHILKLPSLRKYFTIFTGLPLSHIRVASLNHPRNALILEANTHRDFVAYKWGIAPSSSTYKVKKISSKLLSFKAPISPINFGCGRKSTELPDKQSLAFHLAVGNVLKESGIGEVLREFVKEVSNSCIRGELADETEDIFVLLENRIMSSGNYMVR